MIAGLEEKHGINPSDTVAEKIEQVQEKQELLKENENDTDNNSPESVGK